MRGRMRLNALIVTAVFLLHALAWADDSEQMHDHDRMATQSSEYNPPIQITINPEARVSVMLAGELPQSVVLHPVAQFIHLNAPHF